MALLEMRAENEKLDIEREAAQRLLSEMEDAGAQKAAELAALAQENESLSQERTEMEQLVSTAQQQAEATGLELSRTVEENSKLRESAESMQMELHRLKAEKLAQQVRVVHKCPYAVGSCTHKHRHHASLIATCPKLCTFLRVPLLHFTLAANMSSIDMLRLSHHDSIIANAVRAFFR